MAWTYQTVNTSIFSAFFFYQNFNFLRHSTFRHCVYIAHIHYNHTQYCVTDSIFVSMVSYCIVSVSETDDPYRFSS